MWIYVKIHVDCAKIHVDLGVDSENTRGFLKWPWPEKIPRLMHRQKCRHACASKQVFTKTEAKMNIVQEQV